MDCNTLYFLLETEREEVYQRPDKLVFTKLPGKLVVNRWLYRDNPWHGIGEKENRRTLETYSNTTPWEHFER